MGAEKKPATSGADQGKARIEDLKQRPWGGEADEDVGIARLVARVRREIAAGMPLVPKEVIDRICAGENALRVVRE